MTDELIIAPRPNQRAAVPLPEGMTREAIEHAAALLTAGGQRPATHEGTTIDRQGYRYLRAETVQLIAEVGAVGGLTQGNA